MSAGELTSARVEARWDAVAGSASAPPVAAALQGSTVTVRPSDDDAGSAEAATFRNLSVLARTPPRFFSVTVETDGPVSVDTVVEGSVRVSSGASASVHRCRGGDLVLRCAGDASVSDAAAQTDIETRGGAVRIARLVGRDVRIATAGGSVHVGSAFVERLSVDSSAGPSGSGGAARGGDVTFGSLRVEETAEARGMGRHTSSQAPPVPASITGRL